MLSLENLHSMKTTFISAVIAGQASPLDINLWIDLWHEHDFDDAQRLELPAFLGFTNEEYSQWLIRPNVLQDVLADHGWINPDVDEGPLKIRFNIPARQQESCFMNATLSSAKDEMAISVAVSPPEDFDVSPVALTARLRQAFNSLIADGWTVEAQVGPDEEPELTDEGKMRILKLAGLVPEA